MTPKPRAVPGRLARIALPSLVALSGLPALGQSMMDREGPPPRAHPAAASSPAEILRAAACVVASGSATAGAVLASTPQSPEERDAASALLREGERCLRIGRPLVTAIAILRGAAAESLYEAGFTAPVAARRPAIAALPMPGPRTRAGSVADALAECVAASRQDLVRALLAAAPGTAAEQAALRPLDPVCSACMPPGVRMRADRGALRGLLAEALYRWSVVQRDGPASPLAAAPAQASPAPASAARTTASH